MALDNKFLNYELIGTIEHSGSWDVNTGGAGHYTARARGADRRWRLYNDNSVNFCGATPTPNTHAVIYHLISHGPKETIPSASLGKKYY